MYFILCFEFFVAAFSYIVTSFDLIPSILSNCEVRFLIALSCAKISSIIMPVSKQASEELS
ncbi:hypothetical protein AGMMS49950_02690 [Endomicrobiia bacterium]|nr:hypothetical protein AGMMS49531_03080 [Endomicrobiia bacterium]GHT69611.1 hypothetical protein AGMMS49950_02690 [Endomicrobiia bacterium]